MLPARSPARTPEPAASSAGAIGAPAGQQASLTSGPPPATRRAAEAAKTAKAAKAAKAAEAAKAVKATSRASPASWPRRPVAAVEPRGPTGARRPGPSAAPGARRAALALLLAGLLAAPGAAASAGLAEPAGQRALLELVKASFAGAGARQSTLAPQQPAPQPAPPPPPSPPPAKSRPGQAREHQHYTTTYACEGRQLELGCGQRKLIHLVRANYGRFSLSICNDLGHSNLSVQCASFRAFLIMEARCNKLSNCSVVVSPELFGDPCEGTSKYLEVQYYCDEGSPPQPPGPPQPPPTAGRPLSAANQQQVAQEGHKSPAGVGAAAAVAPPPPPPPARPRQEADEQPEPPPQPPQDGPPTDGASADAPVIGCPGQLSARGLYWPATAGGQAARQACPDGASGEARWLCDGATGRFKPAWSPDLAACASAWLARVARQLEAPAPAGSGAHESALRQALGELTLMARAKQLFGADLVRLEALAGQLVSRLRSLWAQPASSKQALGELAGQLLELLGACFERGQRGAWLELAADEQRRQLERRLLGQLRDAAALAALAGAGGGAPLTLARGPNVLVRLSGALDLEQPWAAPGPDWPAAGEVRAPPALLKQLQAMGVARLLALELRKAGEQSSPAPPGEPPLASSRALGVFALQPDSPQALDLDQLGPRAQELLARWPLALDFKLGPQQRKQRCQSLSGEPRACQLAAWNASAQVCRCQRLGFVQLAAPAGSEPEPDELWQVAQPQLAGPPPASPSDLSALDLAPFELAPGPPATPPPPLSAPGAPSGSLGTWPVAAGVLGLVLACLSLVALALNASLRAAAHTSAGPGSGPDERKLAAGFLSGALAATGHALRGSGAGLQPLAPGEPGSLMGLSQATGYPNSAAATYKPAHQQHPMQAQQLYAAPGSPLHSYERPRWLAAGSSCGSLAGGARWPAAAAAVRWLRRRLAGPGAASCEAPGAAKAEQLAPARPVHQQVHLAGHLHQYHAANGYAAQPATVGRRQQQAPPTGSSSNSSYVSSLAYYEEVGPGAKHTVVDPFRHERRLAPAAGLQQQQQQLLHQPHPNQPHPNQPHPNQQHQWVVSASAAGHAHSLQQAAGQSGASSVSSQHSASTSLTTATGSTPRHYLFASPSAASAFKSQQQLLGQQQQNAIYHNAFSPAAGQLQ